MSNYGNMDLERLAGTFKALSNPQRLQIFLKLVACCRQGMSCDDDPEAIRCCVGELGAGLGISASTVSHHLKELRQAGLMQTERRGQKIECRVCDEALGLVAAFFGKVTGDADRSWAGTDNERTTR